MSGQLCHGHGAPTRRWPVGGWVRNSEVWIEVKYRFRGHLSLTQQMVIEHLIDASPQ